MTCKDCIHYDVCLLGACINGVTGTCLNFKDKSRFIELPCKVGDTVHYFSGDFGTILPYFVENLNIAYLGEKGENCVYTFEANCNHENELLDSIDFEPDDIGKAVFLTREEAEKALERSKSDETNI